MQVGFNPEFRRPGLRSGTEYAAGGLLRLPHCPGREDRRYEAVPEAEKSQEGFRKSEKLREKGSGCRIFPGFPAVRTRMSCPFRSKKKRLQQNNTFFEKSPVTRYPGKGSFHGAERNTGISASLRIAGSKKVPASAFHIPGSEFQIHNRVQ